MIDHSPPPAPPHDSSPPLGEIGRLREVEIEIERGRRSGDGGGLLFGIFGHFLRVFLLIFGPFCWSPELVIFGPFCR
jgi:hypothetical protein